MRKIPILVVCLWCFVSMRAQAEPAPLEIAAVADMALEDGDRMRLREAVLLLEGEPDPFLQLNAVIVLAEEKKVEVEEAFLTLRPFEADLRLGRLRPRIGQTLQEHRHDLDTVDEPLAIQHYFGEEGMSKTGAELTKTLFGSEGTLGIMQGGNGEEGTVFGESERRPTVYARIQNRFVLDTATELELGLSDAIGSRDTDASFEVNVLGFDATLIHHLNSNQALKFQGELFNVDRSESFIDVEDPDTAVITQQDIDGNVWGAYALADFRFHSQWAAGFRFDSVEPVDNPLENPDKAEIGYTGYLTFHQSEFARWRVQFSHVELATGSDDNRVFLQGTFAIGEHKRKIQ